jgi:hypothetical protein
MSNNLLVSYDLNSPGQNYTTVIDEIKSLGSWANVQKSHWYVSSNLTAIEARDRVSSVMDNNDSLVVIDASNDSVAWNNLYIEISDHIENSWRK